MCVCVIYTFNKEIKRTLSWEHRLFPVVKAALSQLLLKNTHTSRLWDVVRVQDLYALFQFSGLLDVANAGVEV